MYWRLNFLHSHFLEIAKRNVSLAFSQILAITIHHPSKTQGVSELQPVELLSQITRHVSRFQNFAHKRKFL